MLGLRIQGSVAFDACSVSGGHGDRNACRVVCCALALLAKKFVVPGTLS